jgi:DNA-binding MarR family transcriptional regulator
MSSRNPSAQKRSGKNALPSKLSAAAAPAPRAASAHRQQLFSSLHRAVRLFIAGSSLFSQRVAEKLGMHPTDIQFLNVLNLLGPLTPGALAQCSGLSTGGVTVVLDRLEKAGYVRRTSNPADRRSVLVVLQPGRQKRVNVHYESVEQQFVSVLEGFSEDELGTVLKFFLTANETRPAPMRSGTKTSAD